MINSTCTFCQIGCGILVHVDNGRVTWIEGDPDSPFSEGTLCPKGLASVEYLYHPDRLQRPLKRQGERGEGKWLPIDWDEALDIIANKLAKAKDKYGAKSTVFIHGSSKGNLVSEYLKRFANLFGSPNVIGTAYVCMVPRRSASKLTYGFYAIPDYDYPPAAIVIWGKNPAVTVHHVYRRILRAVENGAKLMVITPDKNKGAARADLWLKPRPGSDLALALGMLNVIITEGLYDKAFVEQWTVGFDRLSAHVIDYSPEKVADITWIPFPENSL